MIAQLDKTFIKISKRKTYTRLFSYFFEGRPLTTKGRWINPLVFFTYRVFNELNLTKKVEKPIFVIGTGRSGTTILGLTLSIHRDVAFLNEPKAFWSHIIDSEDLIGSYSKKPGKYSIDPGILEDKSIKAARNILGNYLAFSGATRLVDKYPELIFRTDIVRKIHPEAKFLFLYRNGWDTCHSIDTWSKRLGVTTEHEIHDWWGRNEQKWLALQELVENDPVLSCHANTIFKYTDHQSRAAVEWILTMKKGLQLLEQIPDAVMGVKYERFVADEPFREEILNFCELDDDINFTTYCSATLTPPAPKPPIKLPEEIKNEFHRVMRELGYE